MTLSEYELRYNNSTDNSHGGTMKQGYEYMMPTIEDQDDDRLDTLENNIDKVEKSLNLKV